MKPIILKVKHCHPEPNVDGNIECYPIENLESSCGFVYVCPQCQTEILVTLKEAK